MIKKAKPNVFDTVPDISKKQEKELARDMKGHRISGSGAVHYSKGDIELPGYLVEAKTTAKKSISITVKWLDKIFMEAMAKGKEPALAIRLPTDKAPKDWVMVPKSEFKELTDEPVHEPGETICKTSCPCCGADLEVMHGEDEGEIGVLGRQKNET